VSGNLQSSEFWADYGLLGSYRLTPGLRTNRKKSSYFLFADK
jgi:hypothetical protein